MPSADSWRLTILNVSVRGRAVPTRTKAGHCLGPRSGCPARNSRTCPGSNVGARREHQGRHHPVAHGRVGNRIHRGLGDVGVAHQDPFDGCGAEVLAVDPHPVPVPPGEIREAVLVAVGQVAAVVDTARHPLGLGGLVLVVAAELAPARGVDQFADDTGRALLARCRRRRWSRRRPVGPARHPGCPGCARWTPRPRWSRTRRPPAHRTAGRTGRDPAGHPRFRRRPAADCRRHRRRGEWPGCRTAACRRSWRTSRRTAGRPERMPTRRTCGATRSTRPLPPPDPSPP